MTDRVSIREAILDDRIAFREWRNDPITKKVFNVKESVDRDRHNLWFGRKMEDKGQILCIGSVSTVRVGCVRFDQHADGEYEVNIYIRPPYCGKGYAAPILRESINYLANSRNAKKYFADVKRINSSSGNIFEEAGFVCVKKNESQMHYELIV